MKMKPVYCLAIVYESGAIYIDSNVKTEVQLAGLIGQHEKAAIKRVKVDESQKRSMTANALLHVWCQQLSGFTGNDVLTQKAELKIKFGYPILRNNAEIWPRLKKLFIGAQWQKILWPEKIEMSELIPCTSIMTTKELKLMMDNIKDWAMNQFNIELDNDKGDR